MPRYAIQQKCLKRHSAEMLKTLPFLEQLKFEPLNEVFVHDRDRCMTQMSADFD